MSPEKSKEMGATESVTRMLHVTQPSAFCAHSPRRNSLLRPSRWRQTLFQPCTNPLNLLDRVLSYIHSHSGCHVTRRGSVRPFKGVKKVLITLQMDHSCSGKACMRAHRAQRTTRWTARQATQLTARARRPFAP